MGAQIPSSVLHGILYSGSPNEGEFSVLFVPTKDEIPLRYLVRSWFEARHITAAS